MGRARDVVPARGPVSYLWWLVRCQRRRVAAGAVLSTLSMVGLTLPPYLLSRAVDDGLVPGRSSALLGWSAALLGVGVVNAWLSIMRHRTMTRVRMDASFRTTRVVLEQVTRLGASLSRRVAAGEVVTIGSADLSAITRSMTVTGPGTAAVIAYLVVAWLLLSVSAVLAAVVLLGVPMLMAVVGPLLGRLQGVQTSYREGPESARCAPGRHRRGPASAQRLRRQADLRRALPDRLDAAARAGLPGRRGDQLDRRARGGPARGVPRGRDVDGRAAGRAGHDHGRSARRGLRLRRGAGGSGVVLHRGRLRHHPWAGRGPAGHSVPGPATHDRRRRWSGSGTPGRAARQDIRRPGGAGSDDGHRQRPPGGVRGRSGAPWPLRRLRRDVGPWPARRGRPHRGAPAILLADNDADLFAGTLRDVLAGRTDRDDQAITHAIHTAAADDVVLGLRHGLDSGVEAHGRNLSGGQRQRIRLARALLTDPEVLLAVEPTSALDAHTEAILAGRLHAARADRTTVVTTTSALLLDHVDTVQLLVDDRVIATGSHRTLLDTHLAYRDLIVRGDADGTAEADAPTATDAR